MPKLAVRQWMVVGLVIFALAAAAAYHAISLVNDALFHITQPGSQAQTAALDAIERAADSPGWADPAWQASLKALLDQNRINVILVDRAGRTVFSGGPLSGATSRLSTVDVVEAGSRLGAIELFGPRKSDWFAPLGASLALAVAVLFVRWQMGRYVVRPLEAMAVAANKIAIGDLDISLPKTTVSEVDDVCAAFKTMTSSLQESLTRQAQLEEQRRFFIGAVAHDLRTPLFALRGYLTGLEQGVAGSPGKVASYAAVCRQKADQLERLVEDLFAYTRAEYLQQTLRREPLDLGTLLTRTAEGFRAQAAERRIEICTKGPPSGCLVAGDESLLERAVENLLDNALRYGEPVGRVEIAWGVNGSRTTFTIADTGPGIAERDLPQIFEPFYRGEGSRSRETGGTGLGLSIAKRVLRAHGGDLVAANRKTGGAEFTGWLPLRESQ